MKQIALHYIKEQPPQTAWPNQCSNITKERPKRFQNAYIILHDKLYESI